MVLRDWWSYLMVAAAGGQVVFDDKPEILYRQHGGKAVGGSVSKLRRAVSAVRRGPSPFLDTLAANIAALGASPHPTQESRSTLAALELLRHVGPLERLRSLREARLCRQSFSENALLRLWVALRKLP